MSDAHAPGTVEAVQAAAVERALADGAVARDHLALVGALEATRPTAGSGPFAAAAATVLAVRLRRGAGRGPPPPPAPGGADGPGPAIEGAAVAHRRFGVAADRAATLAGVPVASVRATLD